MLHAALSGRLDAAPFRTDDVFGFEVPEKVPGVDARLLDPRSTWRDPEAYDEQAEKLARMFVENFTKFGDEVAPDVAAAAPRS
jgi:phosphoenolpyruvate carboxykinase (ATP)